MANQKPSFRKTRVEQHAKQKKKNFVLNILIGIVFVSILIVGANILFKDNDNMATSKTDNSSQEVEHKENTPLEEDANKENQTSKPKLEDSETDEFTEEVDSEKSSDEDDTKTGEDDLIIGESEDPNVEQVIVNPNWEPIGTVQSGEHVSSYSEGTTDRQEMDKAMEIATGVSVDNMTVWWVGNGGRPNENVVGTISTKDKSQIYRVYMDWIDGEGWKPTKVEKLKSIDK